MFRVFAATLPLLGLSLTSRDLSALELGWTWVGDGDCKNGLGEAVYELKDGGILREEPEV